MKGKVGLINLFATWCGPCQTELAELQETLWPKYKNNKDFVMLVIGREHTDEQLQKYVIVDGFHRNLVMRKYKDIEERCHGRLPIVVIDKNIDQRMASTLRHNRARGSHSVDGMTNIIF